MTKKNSNIPSFYDQIVEKLQTVYDPEFPLIDIYTLGLIYDIVIDTDEKIIFLQMTFTTPACPMADLIEELVRNALRELAPDHSVNLEITFDPLRNPDMIKDEDLKRMFM